MLGELPTKTTISACIPDHIAKLAEEIAQKENVTVDQIVAMALSAHVSARDIREDIESRAKRGNVADLDRILSKVPNCAPLPGDEL